MSVVLREMVLVRGSVVLVWWQYIIMRIYACYRDVGVFGYGMFYDTFYGKFVVVFELGIFWGLWVL